MIMYTMATYYTYVLIFMLMGIVYIYVTAINTRAQKCAHFDILLLQFEVSKYCCLSALKVKVHKIFATPCPAHYDDWSAACKKKF